MLDTTAFPVFIYNSARILRAYWPILTKFSILSIGFRPLLLRPIFLKMVRSILNQCLTGLSTGTSCIVQQDSFFFFIIGVVTKVYEESSVDWFKICGNFIRKRVKANCVPLYSVKFCIAPYSLHTRRWSRFIIISMSCNKFNKSFKLSKGGIAHW